MKNILKILSESVTLESVIREQADVTVMPWGQHAGKKISELPHDYLKNLLIFYNTSDVPQKLKTMSPELGKSIANELGYVSVEEFLAKYQERATKSQWFGDLYGSYSDIDVVLVGAQKDKQSKYGAYNLYRFKVLDGGQQLVCFTKKDLDVDPENKDKVYRISFDVKKHDEYQGKKTTVVGSISISGSYDLEAYATKEPEAVAPTPKPPEAPPTEDDVGKQIDDLLATPEYDEDEHLGQHIFSFETLSDETNYKPPLFDTSRKIIFIGMSHPEKRPYILDAFRNTGNELGAYWAPFYWKDADSAAKALDILEHLRKPQLVYFAGLEEELEANDYKGGWKFFDYAKGLSILKDQDYDFYEKAIVEWPREKIEFAKSQVPAQQAAEFEKTKEALDLPPEEEEADESVFEEGFRRRAERRTLTEILQEAFSNYIYSIPKDRETVLWDFYLFSVYSLDAIPMRSRDPKVENTWENRLRSMGPTGRLPDMKLMQVFYENGIILTNYLKKHLLNATYFCLTCELRHIYDAAHTDSGGRKKFFIDRGALDFYEKYDKAFKRLQQYGSGEDIPRGKRRYKKSASSSRRNSYRATLATRWPRERIVELIRDCFNDMSWSSMYGGPKWGAIAEGWLMLYNAYDIGEKVKYIDHVYDLEHNTGVVFNKLSTYMKDGGYGWLKYALDFKANEKNVWRIWEHASDGFRRFMAAVIHSLTGQSAEEMLSDAKGYGPYNINVGDYVKIHPNAAQLDHVKWEKNGHTKKPKEIQGTTVKVTGKGHQEYSFEGEALINGYDYEFGYEVITKKLNKEEIKNMEKEIEEEKKKAEKKKYREMIKELGPWNFTNLKEGDKVLIKKDAEEIMAGNWVPDMNWIPGSVVTIYTIYSGEKYFKIKYNSGTQNDSFKLFYKTIEDKAADAPEVELTHTDFRAGDYVLLKNNASEIDSIAWNKDGMMDWLDGKVVKISGRMPKYFKIYDENHNKYWKLGYVTIDKKVDRAFKKEYEKIDYSKLQFNQNTVNVGDVVLIKKDAPYVNHVGWNKQGKMNWIAGSEVEVVQTKPSSFLIQDKNAPSEHWRLGYEVIEKKVGAKTADKMVQTYGPENVAVGDSVVIKKDVKQIGGRWDSSMNHLLGSTVRITGKSSKYFVANHPDDPFTDWNIPYKAIEKKAMLQGVKEGLERIIELSGIEREKVG